MVSNYKWALLVDHNLTTLKDVSNYYKIILEFRKTLLSFDQYFSIGGTNRIKPTYLNV